MGSIHTNRQVAIHDTFSLSDRFVLLQYKTDAAVTIVVLDRHSKLTNVTAI